MAGPGVKVIAFVSQIAPGRIPRRGVTQVIA